MLPFAVRPLGTSGLAVAYRSALGDSAEIQGVNLRDGAVRWKFAAPKLMPDQSIVADAKTVVIARAGEKYTLGTLLVAIDAVTGAPKWETKVDEALGGMWIFDDVLLFRTTGTEAKTYTAFSLTDGRQLWRAGRGHPQYQPQRFGNALVSPIEHRVGTALSVIDLKTGEAHETGAGFYFPGAPNGDGYIVRQPPAVMTLDAKGKYTQTKLLDHERGQLFTLYKGEVLYEVDKAHALRWGKKVLRAPDGFRFAATPDVLHLETWPYGAPQSRYVPAPLKSDATDEMRACVLDLDTLTFSWCASRSLVSSLTSRGRWHFLHLGASVLVLDGNTGKTHAVLALDGALAKWPFWQLSDWVVLDDVLVCHSGDDVWAVDLRERKLAWQRGPAVVRLRDARADAEAMLGSLP